MQDRPGPPDDVDRPTEAEAPAAPDMGDGVSPAPPTTESEPPAAAAPAPGEAPPPSPLSDHIPLDLAGDIAATRADAIADEPLDAEPAPRRPRAWPSIVVALGVTPITMVVAGFLLGIIAALQLPPGQATDTAALEAWMNNFINSPAGFVTMALTAQCMILLTALVPASISPEPLPSRLALGKPRLPAWSLLAFVLATPLVGLITYWIMPFLSEDPGESLKFIDETIRNAQGSQAIWFILLISVLPGLGEELLFRGYVQSRLIKTWGAPIAITFATAAFAVMHWDPHHIAAVIPLGLWMGIIAWRAASVWPAIACHAYNNFYSCVLSRMAIQESDVTNTDGAVLVLLPLGAMSLAIYALIRGMRRSESAAADEYAKPREGLFLLALLIAAVYTGIWMANGLAGGRGN